MGDRITRFAIQADGSRAYQVRVGACKVLVTAPEGYLDEGEALAQAITAIGPDTTPAPVRHEPAPAPECAPKRRAFAVGQRVWCNVHGSQGYCSVTAVGEGRRRGEIKITGCAMWCPASNFDAEGP